jgi:tRNA dimethylallyltransferase
MNMPRESPLLAIVGPTASGKSTLAVWLAERLDGEVIACDSTQLYRGFDIGTAKPTPEERGGVAHHLLDVLDGGEVSTAGAYREHVIEVLNELRARKKLPVFTVGTGLYLRALLEGLADVPQRSEQLRERLWAGTEEHGPGYLHRVLKKLDPESANKIAAADEQKLIRAVEVCLLAKRPLSELHRSGRKPLQGWRAIKIGLMPKREALYERVHARTDVMLQRGWLKEVRALLQGSVAENAKAFDFIGYRELRKVLGGKMDLEEARAAIQQATRRYAKRQMTWFRREKGVRWLAGFGDETCIQEEALEIVRAALAGNVSAASESKYN